MAQLLPMSEEMIASRGSAARIARRNLGFDPLAALAAAEAAGLGPVKVNVVLMRGVNDDELEALDQFLETRCAPAGGIADVEMLDGYC